jgi:hypothetical protein
VLNAALLDSRCEGGNSLKPQARISLNYRAKEYLALLSSFSEHHASLLENITILEISLLLRDVCFCPVDRLTWYMVHFCLLSSGSQLVPPSDVLSEVSDEFAVSSHRNMIITYLPSELFFLVDLLSQSFL